MKAMRDALGISSAHATDTPAVEHPMCPDPHHGTYNALSANAAGTTTSHAADSGCPNVARPEVARPEVARPEVARPEVAVARPPLVEELHLAPSWLTRAVHRLRHGPAVIDHDQADAMKNAPSGFAPAAAAAAAAAANVSATLAKAAKAVAEKATDAAHASPLTTTTASSFLSTPSSSTSFWTSPLRAWRSFRDRVAHNRAEAAAAGIMEGLAGLLHDATAAAVHAESKADEVQHALRLALHGGKDPSEPEAHHAATHGWLDWLAHIGHHHGEQQYHSYDHYHHAAKEAPQGHWVKSLASPTSDGGERYPSDRETRTESDLAALRHRTETLVTQIAHALESKGGITAKGKDAAMEAARHEVARLRAAAARVVEAGAKEAGSISRRLDALVARLPSIIAMLGDKGEQRHIDYTRKVEALVESIRDQISGLRSALSRHERHGVKAIVENFEACFV
jgi:hypothetical protein